PSPPPLFDGERLAHMFGSQIGPALRQPIGRIIANAETIGGRLEGPLRSDYAGYAGDIASAGRHLLALIDDLADLEAIEASGFSAASEPVDLADLARRAAGLLALKAADRSIRIDKPAEDESLAATGEFRRVLQVLLNLLGNAINYAPDGSMIWLRLDEGPDWASVTVADQGPGLSEEDQQRLFNKWERLGRSGDGGSGLGLYISRRLALAMQGDLTVESAPGQGARFTLVLPKI
ncbi:sensor histidine kinase, partial [Erythrobacter donghaensis]